MQLKFSSNLSLFCFGLALKLALLPTAVGQLQHHTLDMHWYPGTATWYGDSNGDGSTGKQDLSVFHSLNNNFRVNYSLTYVKDI